MKVSGGDAEGMAEVMTNFFTMLFGIFLTLAILPIALGALLQTVGGNMGVKWLMYGLSLMPGFGAFMVYPATRYASMFGAPIHSLFLPKSVTRAARSISNPIRDPVWMKSNVDMPY